MSETKKTTEETPEPPSYEELAKAAQVLLQRNTALETEIGRMHMLLNAYEQQFADMREAMNQMKSNVDPV